MKRALKFIFCIAILVSYSVFIYKRNLVKEVENSYILAKYNEEENISKNDPLDGENFKFNFSLFNNLAEQQQIRNSEDLLKYIIKRLKISYIEEIDEEKVYENAIKGVLTSLDPHSRYLNKKEYKEMHENIKGEFGGLGIIVTKNTDLFITVISPIEDTPAYKAGIKTGDFISQIDDKNTFDMDLYQAINLMRGKVGEKVKITILRKGELKPLEFVLKREKIKTNPVKGKVINDNIIYIKLTEFKDNLQQDTINMFNKLKATMGQNKLKGFILDLRNNPGGLLTEAVKITELFIDKDQVVVSTKDRNAKSLNLYKTSNGNLLLDKDTPLVVLVNGGSASASEIVAGAVQDYKRGIVLGTKTFGKASVQTVFPLLNGGALLITTARYYTPLNRSIQLDGIIPDIIVKQGKISFDDNKFEDFGEKNLEGHLEREGTEDIVQKTIKENSKKKEKSENLYNNDYQLLRAISLIDEINIIKDSNKTQKEINNLEENTNDIKND